MSDRVQGRPTPPGAWTETEIERDRAAVARRLARARERGPEANVNAAGALARFANRVAAAAATARRHDG